MLGVTVPRSPRSTLRLLERTLLSEFTGVTALTRPQLVKRTGLSRAVVAGLVSELVSSGELVEVDHQRGVTRGRPSTAYRPANATAPVAVVRLHHHRQTSLSLVNEAGTIETIDIETPWSADWSEWSPTIAAAFGSLEQAADDPIRHVVLAVPFPVRVGRGAPHLHPLPPGNPPPVVRRPGEGQPRFVRSDWLRQDPTPALEHLLGRRTVMVNDTNLAAAGEANYGVARNTRASIYLSVRDGVGAGFVLGGRLFTGGFGAAGELAHTQVVQNGPFCPCGNRGCLATQTHDPLVVDALTSRYQHQLTFEDIEELVENNDGVAVRFFRDLGALIAQPLSVAAVLLDPDMIVIDAKLGRAGEPFLQGLRNELSQRCSPDTVSNLRIEQGTLTDATLRGAVIAAQIAELDEDYGVATPPAAPPGT